MYDLEQMINTFKEHAKESVKMHEQFKQDWIKSNPGEKMPNHIEDDFNFPGALLAICQEIDKLWIEIGGR